MSRRLIALAFAALPALSAAVGPTGTLYLTTDGGASLATLRGTSASFSSTAFGSEGPISVYDDVRTTGIAQNGIGSTYDLTGDYVGGAHANSAPSGARDATTDGDVNYVLNAAGRVYRTNRDFGAASPLFNTGVSGGIAYDPTRNSLWVAGDDFMRRYDLSGNLLELFDLATPASSLAFDPADGTLWTGGAFGGGSLLTQYSTGGNVLQSYSFGQAIVGMEFDLAPVPEPASLLVLGLGAAPLLARRRPRPSTHR